MWWRPVAVLALGGCAQIAGIEATTGAQDAPPVDAPSSPDAQLCLGGDARAVDPVTGGCFVYFATPMTRDAARSVCQGLGPTTRLASIQSASENAVIAGLIGTGDAFVGGSDEALEGTFVWDDGTPVQLTNWNAGEPNSGAGGFEEDCIQVIGSLNGLWNDVPCAPPPDGLGTYPFVCERN